MEHKTIDRLSYRSSSKLRYFLSWHVVKVLIARIGMLTASNSPDAMVVTGKFLGNLEISRSIMLNVLHFLLVTILQCFAWFSTSHATHVHSILQSNRIILRIDKHNFCLQKFIAILNKETSPFLPWILLVASLYWMFFIYVRYLPYVAAQNIECVYLGLRIWYICKNTWICYRVKALWFV